VLSSVLALKQMGRVGVPFSPTDFIGYSTKGYAFGDRGGRVAPPKQPGASLQGGVERTPESWGVAEIHLSANVADHSLCPGEIRRPAVEREPLLDNPVLA
jgi:hypothetical protein